MLRLKRSRTVLGQAHVNQRLPELLGMLTASLAIVVALTILGAMPVVGILLLAVLLLSRRFEIAAATVLVISLCIDWYRAERVVALVFAMVLLVILYMTRSAQRPWITSTHSWLWLTFLVLAFLPAVRGALTRHDALIYYPSIVLGALLMCWLGLLLARNTACLRFLYQLFALFGTFVAVHVIIQTTTGVTLFSAPLAADFLQTTSDYTTNGVMRAGSFFIQPNFCGTFLAMMVFLPLGLALECPSLPAKLFYYGETLLILPALLFTYSASAWVATCFGLAIFILFTGRVRHKLQLVFVVAVASAIMVLGFPNQLHLLTQHASDPSELQIRSTLWRDALHLIQAHPVTGVGLGHLAFMQASGPQTFVYLQTSGPVELVDRVLLYDHPHNTYLEWGAMAGLPVLFVFLALVSAYLVDVVRNWIHADAKTRTYVGAGLAGIAALCVASWSNQGWTVAPLAAFGWMLLGTVASPLLMAIVPKPARSTRLAQQTSSAFRCHEGAMDMDHRPMRTSVAQDVRGSSISKIAYVLNAFPTLSETFITQEVRELERTGVDLHLFALAHPPASIATTLDWSGSSPLSYPMRQSRSTLLRVALQRAICSPWRTLRMSITALAQAPRWSSALGQILYATRLARECEHTGITHLHAHYATQPAALARLVHILTGLPYSFTAHAYDIYLTPRKELAAKMRSAKFVVTCTDYNRRYLLELAHRANTPVHRIHHGLDLGAFPKCTPGTTPAGDAPLILAVARLLEKKGLSHLLRACRRLRDQGYRFRCRIVGEGPLHDALAAQVRELDLGACVTLWGPAPHSEVIAMYRQAEIFALPCVIAENGDRDGIPNVLVEALYMGLAVVSTPVSGIPELISHEGDGLLVPQADSDALASALARLLDNPLLRARLGRMGQQTVMERFDLAQNVEHLRQLFCPDAVAVTSHTAGSTELSTSLLV